MTKNKLIETAKTVLIVLLVINALLLGSATTLFDSVLSISSLVDKTGDAISSIFDRGSSYSGTTGSKAMLSPAARPFFMGVTWEDGSRYGVKYNDDEIENLYSKFSVALGEALGSSGEAEDVTEKEWETAISGKSVYFDFLYPQPLSVIAQWLGTDLHGNASSHTARRICLAEVEGKLVLYYIRSADGVIYSCDTALDFSYISSNMAQYVPNGAQFAFEIGGDLKQLDPYTMLLETAPKINAVTVSNPLQSGGADSLLPKFKMNSLVATFYTEVNGTVVYVESSADGESTLRISPTGNVTYRQTGDGYYILSDAERNYSTAEIIDAAYTLVNDSIGLWSDGATIGLTDVVYDSSLETYTIKFDYIINGLRVYLNGGGHAAEVQIKGRALSYVSLNFRQFWLSSTTYSPLPEKLAAAATVAAKGAGEPVLVYEENGNEAAPVWIIY